MKELLTFIHITCGTICLISGLMPMFSKKGGKIHRRAGATFFWSMFGIFISALALITFIKFNFFLLIIGVFSFYQCFTGYRVLYRKKPGQQKWFDWAGAIITLLAGLSFIGMGIWRVIEYSSFSSITILLFIFGVLTSLTATTDIRMFLKTDIDEKLWWYYHHLVAFSGAYIAAVTAFAVQMGGTHFPNSEFVWMTWVLPGVIGGLLISFWKRKYMRKHKSAVRV